MGRRFCPLAEVLDAAFGDKAQEIKRVGSILHLDPKPV